jgi:hypothetical protein
MYSSKYIGGLSLHGIFIPHRTYGVAKFGNPLFFPDAGEQDP